MGRMPKARQAILKAAQHIVREHGAGRLTFAELEQHSGVTRGGITYHFATKDVLLRALIESDIAHWCELEDRLRPADAAPRAAELIAYIRAHTERNEERRRFVTGMLSAATLDQSLLDPVRDFERARCAHVQWNDADLREHVLKLAAEGLFWSEVFGCDKLPATARKRLIELMEAMATEWTAGHEDTAPADGAVVPARRGSAGGQRGRQGGARGSGKAAAKSGVARKASGRQPKGRPGSALEGKPKGRSTAAGSSRPGARKAQRTARAVGRRP